MNTKPPTKPPTDEELEALREKGAYIPPWFSKSWYEIGDKTP
jgi:hypothetical protein